MKTKHLLTASAAVLWAFSVLPTCVHAIPPLFSITDLGTLGGTQSAGFSINASGQVAGWGYTSVNNYMHAARWTGTTATDLGTLGRPVFQSIGRGINDSGQVAGDSARSVPGRHAVRWTGTTPTELGSAGTINSDNYGFDINASGQVAGYYQDNDSSGNTFAHAVRWTGTTPTDLGTLGGTESAGYGINASGQVAGYSRTTGDLTTRAVRWTGTTAQALGGLGGMYSRAYGINASGQIVGGATLTGDNVIHAALWTGTTPTDLGSLGGYQSYAYDINASGNVVGMSYTVGNADHPFFYTGGAMYDLYNLLMPGSGYTQLRMLEGSHPLNDLNQIVLTAFTPRDPLNPFVFPEQHAILLTPTPEPASAVLLLGGAALLGLRRRR